MNKSTLILAFFVCYSFLSFGQSNNDNVEIEWGPVQEVSKKNFLIKVIGADETGIYTLSQSKRQYYINKLNPDKLSLTKSVLLETETNGKTRIVEDIYFLQNNIYAHTSFSNAKTKVNYLFAQSIDKTTLKTNPQLKKLAEINFAGFHNRNNGEFNFVVSNDSTKRLVFYNLPYEKGEKEKFGFHVFNQEYELIWEKKVTLPYKEELFEIKDYQLDNSGNLHLLGKVYRGKTKDKSKGVPNYSYIILTYNAESEEVREYPILPKGKYLTEMKIATDKKQDIICAGFYSNSSAERMKGSYFIKIDHATGDILTQEYKEFSDEFLKQNMTEKEEQKAQKKLDKGKDLELYQYDLNDIVFKEDGGYLLIGEQFYIHVSTTYTANGASSTTYYYHNNDIIVISMDENGIAEWSTMIAKRQVTTNDNGYYNSYTYTYSKGNLFFIFNDNRDNINYKQGDYIASYNKDKNSIVTLAVVDETGKYSRKPLFSAKDAEVRIVPTLSKQTSSNTMIIYGNKKKEERFAKITFID
jgi:hypothetical protein